MTLIVKYVNEMNSINPTESISTFSDVAIKFMNATLLQLIEPVPIPRVLCKKRET